MGGDGAFVFFFFLSFRALKEQEAFHWVSASWHRMLCFYCPTYRTKESHYNCDLCMDFLYGFRSYIFFWFIHLTTNMSKSGVQKSRRRKYMTPVLEVPSSMEKMQMHHPILEVQSITENWEVE